MLIKCGCWRLKAPVDSIEWDDLSVPKNESIPRVLFVMTASATCQTNNQRIIARTVGAKTKAARVLGFGFRV
jgi:hypothetical protein